jgi:hypothetical protein
LVIIIRIGGVNSRKQIGSLLTLLSVTTKAHKFLKTKGSQVKNILKFLKKPSKKVVRLARTVLYKGKRQKALTTMKVSGLPCSIRYAMFQDHTCISHNPSH